MRRKFSSMALISGISASTPWRISMAIAYFQEAIRLQPNYVAAYNQLGNVLQGLGQSEEAIAVYQKILEINPNVAAAHCNLGSI